MTEKVLKSEQTLQPNKALKDASSLWSSCLDFSPGVSTVGRMFLVVPPHPRVPQTLLCNLIPTFLSSLQAHAQHGMVHSKETTFMQVTLCQATVSMAEGSVMVNTSLCWARKGRNSASCPPDSQHAGQGCSHLLPAFWEAPQEWYQTD